MKVKKNLLIICEGESTEPNYFHDLRNRVIEQHIDYSIEIRPKPPEQKKEEKKAEEFKLRNGGRRRAITDDPVDESDMIEDAYKAQPTRYVREAQLGIADGTFDEAWAVYDLDGHADHEGAYNLAQRAVGGNKIQVGFSAISFESWILWHFEKNTTVFLKSQCRTGKELHECGQGENPLDCHGADCVTGYMKIKGYIPAGDNVKATRFNALAQHVHKALTNAYEIRQAANTRHPGMPYYKYIPYTTVDRLVFKLLHLPIDYQWVTIDKFSIPGFNLEVTVANGHLHIELVNTRDRRQVINPNMICLVNVQGHVIPLLERRLPEPAALETFDILLADHQQLTPVYISVRSDEGTYQITELP